MTPLSQFEKIISLLVILISSSFVYTNEPIYDLAENPETLPSITHSPTPGMIRSLSTPSVYQYDPLHFYEYDPSNKESHYGPPVSVKSDEVKSISSYSSRTSVATPNTHYTQDTSSAHLTFIPKHRNNNNYDPHNPPREPYYSTIINDIPLPKRNSTDKLPSIPTIASDNFYERLPQEGLSPLSRKAAIRRRQGTRRRSDSEEKRLELISKENEIEISILHGRE